MSCYILMVIYIRDLLKFYNNVKTTRESRHLDNSRWVRRKMQNQVEIVEKISSSFSKILEKNWWNIYYNALSL